MPANQTFWTASVGSDSRQDQQQEQEQRYEIRFSVSEEFCRDLERAKTVCSRSWNVEAIMGRAIKDLLEKRDPERKEARRKKREARKQSRSQNKSPDKPATASGAKSASERNSSGERSRISTGRSRHIPAQLRDAVFTRDNGRCTYTSSLGMQCDSTAHLQIDHITPFCLGGEHSLKNLRLLCGKHNRLAAREMSLITR